MFGRSNPPFLDARLTQHTVTHAHTDTDTDTNTDTDAQTQADMQAWKHDIGTTGCLLDTEGLAHAVISQLAHTWWRRAPVCVAQVRERR